MNVLCTVCILARGVTLADAFDDDAALGKHIHAEHTEEEVLATLILRDALRDPHVEEGGQ